MMARPYPRWTDFPIEQIHYGTAPLIGIGVYTRNLEFSWPDREGTMKREYDAWVAHLKAHDYEVPDEYVDAYVTPKAKGQGDADT